MADFAADAGLARRGGERNRADQRDQNLELDFRSWSARLILLHGRLANANYRGNQVQALQGRYEVIVMNSRDHGRSPSNDMPYSYTLMASDVIGLMDFLTVEKAAIIGWSDGAIIGLDIAMTHPERLAKLFAFAANSDPGGTAGAGQNPVARAYRARAETEGRALSPTPTEYSSFAGLIGKMWSSQANWTHLGPDAK